jgi:glycine/serine hydroxymethyltransferase
MGEAEMVQIADLIASAIREPDTADAVARDVGDLVSRFPAYDRAPATV